MWESPLFIKLPEHIADALIQRSGCHHTSCSKPNLLLEPSAENVSLLSIANALLMGFSGNPRGSCYSKMGIYHTIRQMCLTSKAWCKFDIEDLSSECLASKAWSKIDIEDLSSERLTSKAWSKVDIEDLSSRIAYYLVRYFSLIQKKEMLLWDCRAEKVGEPDPWYKGDRNLPGFIKFSGHEFTLGWSWLLPGHGSRYLHSLAKNKYSSLEVTSPNGPRRLRDLIKEKNNNLGVSLSEGDGSLIMLPHALFKCLHWLRSEETLTGLDFGEKGKARAAIGHQLQEVKSVFSCTPIQPTWISGFGSIW